MNNAQPKKKKAILDNWFSIDLPDGGTCLAGIVTGHAHLRDGEEIYTSRVIRVIPNAGIAETVNTLYVLGKPRK